jgi:hypothetical protein
MFLARLDLRRLKRRSTVAWWRRAGCNWAAATVVMDAAKLGGSFATPVLPAERAGGTVAGPDDTDSDPHRQSAGWGVEQAAIDAAWRLEGVAVLAWALRRFRLAAYDQQVDAEGAAGGARG